MAKVVEVETMFDQHNVVAVGFSFAQAPNLKQRATDEIASAFATKTDAFGQLTFFNGANDTDVILLLGKPVEDASDIISLLAGVSKRLGFNIATSTRDEQGIGARLRFQAQLQEHERTFTMRREPVIVWLRRPSPTSTTVMAIALDFTRVPAIKGRFITEFQDALRDNTTGLEPVRIAVAEAPDVHDVAVWFDGPNGGDFEMVWAILRALIERRMGYAVSGVLHTECAEVWANEDYPVLARTVPITFI